MEFEGRISRVLPKQSGTSQKTGNQWERLPFVFEYFERPEDRWPDRVLLDTMDTNIMPGIQEGLEVRIGFGHSVREYEGRVYNELRMYKIESLAKLKKQEESAPAAQPKPQATQPQQEKDDLPF